MLAKVIVRLPNWLGDTVMAVPAVRALRAALPEARVLLAGPWASLLAGQGLGDVLVAYPRQWRGRLRTADAARDFGGEVAVLLPNSLEAALAAWYWRVPRRIGFAVGGRSWLLTERIPLPAPRLHQIDEYVKLVEPLAGPTAVTTPALVPAAPGSAERRGVDDLLAAAGVAAGERALIGIQLGAAYGPSKAWPVERVIEFCRVVAADGAVPVLLGTAADRTQAAEVERATRARSLVGRDGAGLLPAVLATLDGLVSGDTGVAHLAAALGTPVVTLFGPTDPALTAPRGAADVVRHAVPCAPCFYRECPIEHPCLRSITAGEVYARLRPRLLRGARMSGEAPS